MNMEEVQVVFDSAIAAVDAMRLEDGSLPPTFDGILPRTFVHHVLALCLADSVNMAGTFYLLHKGLSNQSVLEGPIDNYTANFFLGWVEDIASSPYPGCWCVLGHGVFETTAEALLAKVKAAKAAQLTQLVRYLRDEVLVARSSENGEEVSPAAAAAAAAASTSSLTPQIHGLRGVLTSLCEIYEARVAEMEAGPAVVSRQRGSLRNEMRNAAARGQDGSRRGEREYAHITAQVDQVKDMMEKGFAKLSSQQEMVLAALSNLSSQQEKLMAGQQKLEAEFGLLRSSSLPLSRSSPARAASGGRDAGGIAADGRSTEPLERLSTSRAPAGGGATVSSGGVEAADSATDNPTNEPTDDVADVTPAGNAAASAASAACVDDGDAGLVSGEDEADHSSMELPAVLPTVMGDEGCGEEGREPLNVSASTSGVTPTPRSGVQEMIMTERVDEISARLGRLLRSATLSGTDNVQSTDPEDDFLADIRAATVAVREVREDVDALVMGAIAREQEAAGGDSERVPAVSHGLQDGATTSQASGPALALGEESGPASFSGGKALQGQRTRGGSCAWTEGAKTPGARGCAGTSALWSTTGIYANGLASPVSHVLQEEPVTVAGDAADAAVDTTVTGVMVGSVSGGDVERSSGATAMPLPEATAEPRKSAVEDDGVQGEGTDDFEEEPARNLAVEMVGCILSTAVDDRVSYIIGAVEDTAMEESSAVDGALSAGGGAGMGSNATGFALGAGSGTLWGNRVDSSYPVGAAFGGHLHRPITVPDAVGGSAKAKARCGNIGRRLERGSGEIPTPQQGASDQGVVAFQDLAFEDMFDEVRTVAVSKAGLLGQPGATMETAAPAGGAEAAPRPVSGTDAAEGVLSQQALEGKDERGGQRVEAPSMPHGVAIRRLEMSAKERSMDGAPQGDVFDVVVLKREQLEPSSDVSMDLEVVRREYAGDDWPNLFGAVNSARTLLKHHAAVFQGEQAGEGGQEDGVSGLLGGVVVLVTSAASGKRSALRTIGLTCMAELLSHELGRRLGAEEMGALVDAALACHKLSTNVSRNDADKAMDAAVANADLVTLLNAVLKKSLDKHPKVVARAMAYVGKCLSRLEVGDVPGNGVPKGVELKSLALGLAAGAASRIADVKDAAWQSLDRCRKALGEQAFQAFITDNADERRAPAAEGRVSVESNSAAAPTASDRPFLPRSPTTTTDARQPQQQQHQQQQQHVSSPCSSSIS
eukprot:g12959.t1